MNISEFVTKKTIISVISGSETKTVKAAGEFIPVEIFVSNEQRRVAEIVIDFTVNFVLAYLGLATNTIVVMVFARQGFKDSVAVSMTVIAFWDFLKCLGAAAQRLSGPISLASPVIAQSWTNISVVVFNYIISFSTYVSSVLAGYVAVERCLCVSIPFKVKWLITPKMTLCLCVTISVVVFGCFMVIFFVYDILWVYSEKYNATLAVYVYNDFFYSNAGPLFQYYNLSGICWPTSSLVVIVVSTVIIAYHLKKSTHFRSMTAGHAHTAQTHQGKSTNDEAQKQLSTRDRQVVKMLLVVIGAYIVNLSPRIIHYTVKYFIYEFYFLRLYHNVFMVMTYILPVFDLTHAAINLFIFYPMSSSFRATFWEIFGCTKTEIPKRQVSKSMS